jgi:hypothetical protein
MLWALEAVEQEDIDLIRNFFGPRLSFASALLKTLLSKLLVSGVAFSSEGEFTNSASA